MLFSTFTANKNDNYHVKELVSKLKIWKIPKFSLIIMNYYIDYSLCFNKLLYKLFPSICHVM